MSIPPLALPALPPLGLYGAVIGYVGSAMTFQELYSAAEALPRVVLLGGKFIIGWPFCYHAINGCRHLVRMCVHVCVGMCLCACLTKADFMQLVFSCKGHLVHETKLLPSSMLSGLHVMSQCVRHTYIHDCVTV